MIYEYMLVGFGIEMEPRILYIQNIINETSKGGSLGGNGVGGGGGVNLSPPLPPNGLWG